MPLFELPIENNEHPNFEWRGGEGGVWILLFSVVALVEYNVSTILSPFVVSPRFPPKERFANVLKFCALCYCRICQIYWMKIAQQTQSSLELMGKKVDGYKVWWARFVGEVQGCLHQFIPCKRIQYRLGFWIPSNGFRLPGTRFFVNGTWIHDSLSCIPDSAEKKFPGFQNSDSITWGEPSLVSRRFRLGHSWTLPWAVTPPRDALSQASRGQQIKRECLGTRLRRTFNKIILITGSSKLQTKAYSREIFLPGSISTNDKPKLSIIIIIITTIIGASADRGETQNCKRFFQRGRTKSSRDFAEITLPVIVFPSQNHGTQNN